MFLEVRRSGYTVKHGEQFAEGYFLLLTQPDIPAWSEETDENGARKLVLFEELKKYPVRGLVRYVRMSQCGHFMMAILRHRGERISLSGCYGSDGLTLTVPMDLYEQGTVLPQDLYEQWAHGNGWNSAGNEAQAMRTWGRTLISKRQCKNIASWQRC